MTLDAAMEKNIIHIVSKHWQENAPKLIFSGHQLCFELDGPDELFIQKAKDELRETPEIVALAYKELRKLIADEPDLHIPNDEDFYIKYLRLCKWYAESAFLRIKRYYRFRQKYPHIFNNFLPSKQKNGFCAGVLYPLPLRNKSGCRILIMEGGERWNPREVSIEDFFKMLILSIAASTLEPKTQIAGGHIIIDMKGLSLNQVSYFTLSFAKMVVEFLQTCLNVRLKGIHIVNQSFIFNVLFAVFMPFLQEKVRKWIHFHGTNWESLMTSTETDKGMLLMKHGGELEMPDEPFGMACWQNILSFEPYFEVEQHYGYKTDKNNT